MERPRHESLPAESLRVERPLFLSVALLRGAWCVSRWNQTRCALSARCDSASPARRGPEGPSRGSGRNDCDGRAKLQCTRRASRGSGGECPQRARRCRRRSIDRTLPLGFPQWPPLEGITLSHKRRVQGSAHDATPPTPSVIPAALDGVASARAVGSVARPGATSPGLSPATLNPPRGDATTRRHPRGQRRRRGPWRSPRARSSGSAARCRRSPRFERAPRRRPASVVRPAR